MDWMCCDTPTWNMPEPGPGQVRVKIDAAGLNFIDIYQRTGQYKMALPFIPGLEAAGHVDALGPEVDGVSVGQVVAYCMTPGAYAQFALCLPTDLCLSRTK